MLIVFHELREIYHRAKGLGGDQAHEKARRDEFPLWGNDALRVRMDMDIEEMDRRTEERKQEKANRS